jgi:hypothetical protein
MVLGAVNTTSIVAFALGTAAVACWTAYGIGWLRGRRLEGTCTTACFLTGGFFFARVLMMFLVSP